MKDVGSMFFRNAKMYLNVRTELKPRRTSSEGTDACVRKKVIAHFEANIMAFEWRLNASSVIQRHCFNR
jgi:hypothetical protein